MDINLIMLVVVYIMILLVVLGLLVLLGIYAWDTYRKKTELNTPEWEKNKLNQIDASKLSVIDKEYIAKRIAKPKGVTPYASYLKLEDHGKEIYVRSFTISELPDDLKFAQTFAPLFNYENAISTAFIVPMDMDDVKKKLERSENVTEANYDGAVENGKKGLAREQARKNRNIRTWAKGIDDEGILMYNFGTLHTIFANSFEELNSISEDFRNKATTAKLQIVNCYGLQKEALKSQLPYNRVFSKKVFNKTFGIRMLKPVIFHPVDGDSVASIYNHTHAEFNQKGGVPIGHNLITKKVVNLDIFAKSNDGYTLIICGKTHAGKSLSAKELVIRNNVARGFKYCGIDSQKRGSRGEFAPVAEMVGGMNIPFRSNGKSDVRLNLFEIIETEIEDIDNGVTYMELAVADKVTELTSIIMRMVQKDAKIKSPQLLVDIKEIVTQSIKKLYDDMGVVEGDIDSLYEYKDGFKGNQITNSRVRKKFKILSDFYKNVITYTYKYKKRNENDKYKAGHYILTSMKEYIKEVNYCLNSGRILSQDDLNTCEIIDGEYIFKDENGITDYVELVRGTKIYFDGQSSVTIDPNCPYTNFDLSMLPDTEDKMTVRQVCMAFIKENFVNKNSMNPNRSNKINVVLDECHENFKDPYIVETIDVLVRTLRKRNGSAWLITQNVTDFDMSQTTKDIFKQAATKIIFKQERQDRDRIKEVLSMTDAQVDELLTLGGTGDLLDDSNQDAHAHRGEACIVNGSNVVYAKFEYEFFKEVEQKAVDTSTDIFEKTFGNKEGAA